MSAALALDFELPVGSIATTPAEYRGLARDDVRMMVAAGADDLRHRRARDLPELLQPGDVLVLNASETLPASLTGVTDRGERVEVHLSTVDRNSPGGPAVALRARRSDWIVELRQPRPVGSVPSDRDRTDTAVRLDGGGELRIVGSYPRGASRARLWSAELVTPAPLLGWLTEHGEPIRYGYVSRRWPLSAYRTTFATTPGSAELPSAGRALTSALLRRVQAVGGQLTSVLLHCGVSSQEDGEPPFPEWYSVPESAATAITAARRSGRRVVAVGTTVVRALEATAGAAGSGWTDVVVTPMRGLSVVDAILTGWHEPRGSHLLLLEALAGRTLLSASYQAALEKGYRWHEFGDLHLILPAR